MAKGVSPLKPGSIFTLCIMTSIPISHITEGLARDIRQEKEAKAFVTKGTKSDQIFTGSTGRNAASHVEAPEGSSS